ncbi:MAG: hypothetical protein JSV65_05925 [Armatimonadota bacterium]|nr:MAG: hypothetical protein JSV65_05925 [Armatimonadota bacterium]
MPRKKPQLTVVEILVILAILGILVAMLAPAVHRARVTATGQTTAVQTEPTEKSKQVDDFFLRP